MCFSLYGMYLCDASSAKLDRAYLYARIYQLTNLAFFPRLQENENDMEVDTTASSVQTTAKHSLPDIEIYCYLLVLIFLIDQKRYDEASLLHMYSCSFSC